MPLHFFYTTVQKSENDQKLKSRGPALKLVSLYDEPHSYIYYVPHAATRLGTWLTERPQHAWELG